MTWQPRAEMEALAAALLPALLLGRIDGKSPIEYVTDEREKAKFEILRADLSQSQQRIVSTSFAMRGAKRFMHEHD